MVTDKKDEELKQALEALETGKNHGVAIDVLRRALADSALNRMAENARELGLDYAPIVEKVEDSVGMGHKAWDMVNPKEIAKAFHEALAEPPCKTGSQCTSKCQQCEQPAQQQEPVAWMWRCKPYCGWPEWSVSLKRPADSGRDGHKRTEGYEDVPLYTSPPASKLWNPEELRRFAALVAAAERAEVERLKLLCEEMLRELYVYRASEYLKDVTAAIRARGKTP